jgi:hypothetical protein
VVDHGAKIVIDAPPEDVWAFHEDEANFLHLNPRAVEHRVTERLPNGGHHCAIVFIGPSGLTEVRSLCITYDPPRRAVWHLLPTSGAPYVSVLEMRVLGNATEVVVEIVGFRANAGCLGYTAGQYLGLLRHEFRKRQLGRP